MITLHLAQVFAILGLTVSTYLLVLGIYLITRGRRLA
jgi:hypothetical protein